MKKLLVVLLALSCLAAAAFADVTVSTAGEITYGIIGNSSSTSDGWPNGYLNITTMVDPNNSLVLGLGGWQTLPKIGNGGENGATTLGALAFLVDPIELFYLKSDLFGALGMDKAMVAPMLYAGLGVFDLPGYQITQYGSERYAAIGIDNGQADGEMGAEAGSAYGLIALDTKVMNIVNIVLATSGTEFTNNNPQALIGAYGTVGPVSFEAGWTSWGSPKGYIPLGLQYSAAMGDIALTAMANLRLNLNDSSFTNNTNAMWSAGAKAVYQGNYTLDAAIMSYPGKIDPTSSQLKLTGDVMVNFSPIVGIVISPYINLDSGAKDAFDTLEAFVWVAFGKTKVRVGYLYMANGGVTDLNVGPDYAPSANGNAGGLWATVDLAF